MFRKKSKDFSIIDEGLTVEGTICCKGKLIVKGTLKGKLEGEHVIIAKNGAIYAETTATNISVGGTLEGDIRSAHELVILSSGICNGKVNCRTLMLERGGILNAEIICASDSGNRDTEK